MNYLYQITNLINNKIYIGVHTTDNINDGYMGSGTAIKRAIKKYGIENFKKDIMGFFDTRELVLTEEEKIVDAGFVMRADTYNLRTGGIGGFEHINNLPICERPNIKEYKRKVASGEIKVGGTQHWSADSRRKVAEIARHNHIYANTESAANKRKDTFKRIQHSKGEKNSQYGRYWISNIDTKEIKRINSDEIIPVGWVRGKKGKSMKTCWINKDSEEFIINLNVLDKCISDGYNKGRINKKFSVSTL